MYILTDVNVLNINIGIKEHWVVKIFLFVLVVVSLMQDINVFVLKIIIGVVKDVNIHLV